MSWAACQMCSEIQYHSKNASTCVCLNEVPIQTKPDRRGQSSLTTTEPSLWPGSITQLHQHDKKICFVFISLIIEKYVRDTCIFPLPPTAPNFQLFKKNFIGESSPPPPSPEKRIGSHSILICVVVYLYGVAGGQHGELPLPGHVVKVVHQHTGEQGWSMWDQPALHFNILFKK